MEGKSTRRKLFLVAVEVEEQKRGLGKNSPPPGSKLKLSRLGETKKKGIRRESPNSQMGSSSVQSYVEEIRKEGDDWGVGT